MSEFLFAETHMTNSPNNDIRKAIGYLAQSEGVKKFGRFRALIWPDEEARDAAAELMRRTPAEHRDDQFWERYYGYCLDVRETPNVAILDGLAGLLCWASGITTSVQKFSKDYTFLGVGNGLVIGQLSAAFTANGTNDSVTIRETPSNYAQNNYNTYTTTVAVGDILLFTDSTTPPPSTNPWPTDPTNVEYAEVASVSAPSGSPLARTVTFTAPLRYSRSSGTYIVVSGRNNATDMVASGFGSSKAYRKVVSTYPTEGLVSGLPTLTWQADYATGEAQFHWTEAVIGSVASPPASATSTFPSGGVLLAKAAWYPSPLFKGGTLASQQYLFSLG
ncbi:MAG: hypothetical protein JSS66_04840 [Armatimonadetes bacterium]|nr:hypothetical protein [Armatimonadota bacterium]